MQIVISRKLSKRLECEESIKKHYGKLASGIIVCISILYGADSLQDVPNAPPTRRHKLVGNYYGCWGIDLDKRWRMILRPIPISLALNEIIRIEIVEIVEYH
jgi:plasmid maintenance system killer protein